LKLIVRDIVSKRWPDSNDLRPKSLPGAAQVVIAHLDRRQALSAKRGAALRMEPLIQFLLAVFRVSLTLIGNLSPFITAT
jgi:hypothetical protein